MSDRELHEIAFPRFSDTQLESLGRCPCTKRRQFRDGERLFAAGDRNSSFFIIRSGQVEIVDESDDAPKTIAVHTPGSFAGDVSQVTGNPAIVSAYARGPVEAYEIANDGLRELLNLHPELGDMILKAFIARRTLLRSSGNFTGLRVIGSRYSQDTFRVRDFLARNRVPFTWLDLEADPQVHELLRQFGLSEADTPVVAWGREVLLRNPSDRELADRLGLRQPLEQVVYDLIIVGGGPAGLAAAVYGASEGLRTVVIERTAPGGQAGRSMRIENYLGFPTGITGSELTDRAVLQANKFGARMPIGSCATRLTFDNAYQVLHLDGKETVTGKCLLIASGAEYRRLKVEGVEPLEGRGVYYAATPTEAQACHGSDVVVVGGGNSAGQAVVFLATQANRVVLVVRAADLHKDMSTYLAHRIEEMPNVEVLLSAVVQRLEGGEQLTGVEVVNTVTGAARHIPTPALFSFIGAVPRTDWLPAEVERDAKGFIRSGPELAPSAAWPLRRSPYLLETTRPGVFAAGDVRSGSVKRVASAVGEGSMAVQFVHEYLKAM